MPRLAPENAGAAMELQCMVAEFFYEIDVNGGAHVTEFYAPDAAFLLGDFKYQGHAAIAKFYADRAERIRVEQKDGIRAARHSFTNFRAAFQDKTHATINFINVQFSGEGKIPVRDFTGPTMVVDCQMQCRRDADGQWRIVMFQGSPVFVGNDPFLNKRVVKN